MDDILKAIYPIALKHTKKIQNATIWPQQVVYEHGLKTASIPPGTNAITIQWTQKDNGQNASSTSSSWPSTCTLIISPETIYLIKTSKKPSQELISKTTIPLTDPQAIQKLEKILAEATLTTSDSKT